MPRSHYYHEEVESYQIIEYDHMHRGGCMEAPRTVRRILFSSSSARMTWLMLRAIEKYQRPNVTREIQVVYEGKLYGMLAFQFMNMIHGSYMYRDDGKDSPIIEWIEIHEPQPYTNTMVYCGTWYECYREVAKWTPERRQQVHVLVMRQKRPTADYNRPYIEHAYPNADEFWQDYDNWTALMTYDKHADYYPILSEADAD